MKKASVIIPTYNSQETLKECLERVLDNDYGDFEVVVIDDKSTDDSLKVLQGLKHKKLRYYSNEINLGASYSRNLGVKKSKGDLVILLDADTLVEKDWIKKHLEAHRNIPADLIGGGVVGMHETIFGTADTFSSWWTSVPFGKDRYPKKFHLPANNISLKREVFEKIGYFNNDLRLGGEDAEFCFRALKNNLKICLKPGITVYHFDRNDWGGFLKHQANWGKHAVKMRRGLNMPISFLMPKSLLTAYFYIIPLAILYTMFIIAKWIRYKPSVLLYSPIIFMGKIKQAIEIKNSFKK